MNNHLAVLVLCGLPGAGKTSFVNVFLSKIQELVKLSERHSDTQTLPDQHDKEELLCSCLFVKHICYDSLIPPDVYKEEREENFIWKTYRKSIVNCVEKDICELLNTEEAGHLPQTDDVIEYVAGKFSSLKWIKCPIHKELAASDALYVVIIDDNMFYPSMRQEYYQLAQKYGTCFSQIYIKTSVEDALRRNNMRDESVPENTIVTMATKLTPPCPDNAWEACSLTLESEKCCEMSSLFLVMRLVMSSAANPVDKKQEIDEAAIAADRLLCSESLLHQADQILRKLIGQEMGQVKEISKIQRQNKASELNTTRKQLMDDLKSGAVLVPVLLEGDVADASKYHKNPFNIFITQSFKERLKS